MATTDYTVGRGVVYFSPFKTGTIEPEGFVDLGNAPEFNLTIESETLDHYSSRQGIREIDAQVVIQANRTGTFILDEIRPDNVARFLYGVTEPLTVTAATGLTETISGVVVGRTYALGVSVSNPTGVRNIANVTVSNGATALTEGTDFSVDYKAGLVTVLSGTTNVNNGDTLTVTYDQVAHTRDRVKAGSSLIEGALMFRSHNITGPDAVWYMPRVTLRANGDMQLIGDDWMQIPMSFSALLPGDGRAAVYRDGVPIA